MALSGLFGTDSGLFPTKAGPFAGEEITIFRRRARVRWNMARAFLGKMALFRFRAQGKDHGPGFRVQGLGQGLGSGG